MSSSKAKKKRKKQRLRLKKKKFNLKELLKKLERDCLADLWKKLAASMAAFDNHSGTRGRPIWEDGLGLFCNKKAMKALMKSYSQPFEPTPNDLNRLQPRAGHTVRSSLNSEATKASQPPEQPFQTRPTPVQKSQPGEPAIRALEKIQGNVRRVVQADAILVNSTVPIDPDEFSWQSSPFFQTASSASIPVLPKTIQEWGAPATVTRSFPGASFATDHPIRSRLSPSVRHQPVVMVPPTPAAAQPSPTVEEHSPTVTLQQEPGGLLPEKGFASRKGKKGNKKSGHLHKKKRHKRYLKESPVDFAEAGKKSTDADSSDSDTSDCGGCTSDSSVCSDEEASDIESDGDNNTGRRRAAKDGEVVQKWNKQTGTPPPLVEDDQKKCDLLYVTLSGITVDNMIHNVVSLGKGVGADVTPKDREIPSVLSSLVPRGPGCGGCSTR